MDLTPGWSLKRQRSKRLEISESSSPSSSSHESDGYSWSITKEGAKVKLKDTKKPVSTFDRSCDLLYQY